MTRFFISVLLIVAAFCATAQKSKIPQPDLPGDLLMDIGLNYWSNDADTLKNWGSKSLGIYYNKRYKISNKLSFYPAVGLSFEKYAFKKNYHYSNNDGIIEIDTLNALVKKNKLAVTYLEVPLELRFHPQGTQEGEGFFVGAGLIGSLRMGSHTKLKYLQGFDEEKRKEKLSDDFGLNDIRYGYQIRVGWKNVHFFYKHYLSDVYGNPQKKVGTDLEPNGRLFNPMASTFGINFSGF
jgi:hypothetical protein